MDRVSSPSTRGCCTDVMRTLWRSSRGNGIAGLSPLGQAELDGYLLRPAGHRPGCPPVRAEGQGQRPGERVEPGPEVQDELLAVAVARAAAEPACVQAAEVVFGVDKHGRPFTLAAGAVDPPPGFGAQVDPPG